jgi:hypothetical protein
MADSTPLAFDALPGGTRWRKCAFQVNPYAYLQANHTTSAATFPNEDSYNVALVAALKAAGVEMIGTADHWCTDTSDGLARVARQEGLVVFPGFEATTKEGVHLLILFDPGTSAADINRRIGECSIPADCRDARPGKWDVTEMLSLAQEWHTAVIAPHVSSGSGLLDVLQGQAATAAWRHNALHAVALSGGATSQKMNSILSNNDPAYRRDHLIAQLRAADLHDPTTASKSGTSCWVKMSSETVDGLDVAFRSPATRVSLSDPTATQHPVLVGMAWDGGFLDGVRVRLNEAFNVLVGGRGSGKSTVVESLRYVFAIDPVGSTAKAEHDAMVKSRDVLGPGTRVRVMVETRKPHVERFIVQRTVPDPPIVLTMTGEKSDLRPQDLVAGMEIYGQRELAELARDRQKLTTLLARYVPDAERAEEEQRRIQRRLRDSRAAITQKQAEIDGLDEQIERLPSLQALLQAFQKAGIADRLSDQAKVQREGSLLEQARRSLEDVPQLVSTVRESGVIDAQFLMPEDVADLPNKELIERAGIALTAFNKAVEPAASQLEEAARVAGEELQKIQAEWETASRATREALNALLREMQPAAADAQDYLNLEKQVTRLLPLAKERRTKAKALDQLGTERTALLVEKESLRAERIRSLTGAARKISKDL